MKAERLRWFEWIILLAVCFVMGLLLRGKMDCNKKHGHYVQGFFRMECVR